MLRLHRILWNSVSFLLGMAVAVSTVACAEQPTIALTLASGRTIQADRIARTGEQGLVLRAGNPNAFIERQVPWNSISQAFVLGQEVSIEELKALSKQVAPEALETDDVPTPRFIADRKVRKASAIRRQANPAVAGVVADGWLGQTNPTKPGEQLQVRISAVDHEGNPVAASGTVEIRFVTAAAETYVRDSGAIGHSPVELGRWTQTLSPHGQPSGVGSWRFDVPRAGGGGATYGMLVVRLVVPGSGVFETVVDGIRRRNFRPVQDALRGEGGVRTLP